MIKTKQDLRRYLDADSRVYKCQFRGVRTIFHNLTTVPGNNDDIIWAYIKTLRYYEYALNNKLRFRKLYYAWKLRKLGYKTGFQIQPNTFEEGLSIYHWGPIIVNRLAKIGKNCTIHPNIVIGEKTHNDVPTIGDNVSIASGAFICGNINVGNNVVIGPNTMLMKSVPDNCTVIGNPAHIIKKDGIRVNIKL